MTLKELCEVIPGTVKLRIKERPGDPEGIPCLRYDIYDPLGLVGIPELQKYQTREVELVRPDLLLDDRLIIILAKDKEG